MIFAPYRYVVTKITHFMRSGLKSQQSRTLLLLGGIFLLGLVLRLYTIDAYGYWGDEIASLDGGRLGLPGLFTQRFGWIGNQTPLHYLIVWLSSQPANPTTTAFWVRLPSALAGAFTVPVVYGLGKEMFGRVQGLFAALMVALSAVSLNYSQDIRSYAILVLLSALSVYCLLRAHSSGLAKWWAAFAVITTFDIFISFFALTLFLPALSPYLAWVLWRVWLARRIAPRVPLYAFLSLVLIAISVVIMAFDMTRTQRLSPDLAQVSYSTLVSSIFELTTWLTRFGLDAQLERLVQYLFLLLAVFGLFRAFLSGGERRANSLLCAFVVLIPGVILAILSTRYVIFQRYALFTLPFYFLLISNSLPSKSEVDTSAKSVTDQNAPSGAFRQPSKPRLLSLRIPSHISNVVMALVTVVFVFGAYMYSSPVGHDNLSYRPGFREVARSLSARARPQDTIIFADDPALGYTITGYYWGGMPPVPAFDVRDPLLYTHNLTGDVYWVVSGDDPRWLAALTSPDNGWTDTQRFSDVAVLHEVHPTGSAFDSVSRIVARLEKINKNYQPVKTLRGTLYQAQGDLVQAVAAYKSAGVYFPTGDEYLRTALGFDALGDSGRAWREALLSKFWEPGKPAVHQWLSQKLLTEGHPAESRTEAAIAAALRP